MQVACLDKLEQLYVSTLKPDDTTLLKHQQLLAKRRAELAGVQAAAAAVVTDSEKPNPSPGQHAAVLAWDLAPTMPPAVQLEHQAGKQSPLAVCTAQLKA